MNVAPARVVAIAIALSAIGFVWCSTFHGGAPPSSSDGGGGGEADAPAPPGTVVTDSAPETSAPEASVPEAAAPTPTCLQTGCDGGLGCCLVFDGGSSCTTLAGCGSNHAFVECLGHTDCVATTTGLCCMAEENAVGVDLTGRSISSVLHTYCGNPGCRSNDLTVCKDTGECGQSQVCAKAVGPGSATFPSEGITDCQN